MPKHAHVVHEMIVLFQGAELVHLANRTFHAQAGGVLFYPMGTAHEEWAEAPAPLETIFLSFRWNGYWPEMPVYIEDLHGRIRQLARWIYTEREAYFPGAAEYRQTLMRSVLAEYVRLLAHEEHQLVQQVRAHVRAHLQEPLTLDMLAARCDLSKFHFARVYRSLTGLSVMEDVRRIRLETARHLLLTTRLPLKAIAQQTGIANEYHLSRLLKTHLGAGARELRARP